MSEQTHDPVEALVDRLVDEGFATVSRNPSDHETSVAYRTAVRRALQLSSAQVNLDGDASLAEELLGIAGDCDSGELNQWEDHEWKEVASTLRIAAIALKRRSRLHQSSAKSEPVEGQQYYIRKGGYYYRPNAQGYTTSKFEAGRYSLEEAMRYTYPNGPDGPRDGLSYEPSAPPAEELASALHDDKRAREIASQQDAPHWPHAAKDVREYWMQIAMIAILSIGQGLARKDALLKEGAELYRSYEAHHRGKISEAGRPEKAERNAAIAARFEQEIGKL